MGISVLNRIQTAAYNIWQSENILDETIQVTARTLTTEEAIGNPEGDDFPLLRGKERLMEAEFRGAKGQAFTDRFGNFSTSLREVAEMDLSNNFRRAIFVSALNAVQCSLGQASNTIHCKDDGPALCAPKLGDYIAEKYGSLRLGLIGYQPAMIKALSSRFEMRIVDLDPDNIGTVKCGITIEGPEDTSSVIEDVNLLVVTGSTIVNDTITRFLRKDKPTIFFGTTVAAAADIMGWERFCCQSN
ncbi:Rossmann-like domain-containing protein [Maridesulfovibrio sp. FT414]|uniref:Rossmann-like domain-containing protein n=1 Tax=Maridesulfovibrio sp. FT414 TaxID=2979469 RepID=UPI003D8079B9